MKNLHFLICLFFLLTAGVSNGQDTLFMKPGPEEGKDAWLKDLIPNTNIAQSQEINASTWTQSGNLRVIRSVVDFNIPVLPPNSSLLSAELTMYVYSHGSNYNGYSLHGQNDLLIYEITSPWDEYSVTWNTMPSVDSNNFVLVPANLLSPPTTSVTIDVMPILTAYYANPNTSYGFLFRMLDEVNTYRVASFASSDNADPSLHPELRIIYQTAVGNTEHEDQDAFTLYPNPANEFVHVNVSPQKTEEVNYQVFDIGGRVVIDCNRQSIENGEFLIPLRDIRPGIYFLSLETENQKFVERFIVH